MTKTLVLATQNAGKAREVKALLPDVEVLTLADLPADLPAGGPRVEMPEETGETFEENAALKASHVSAALGAPVLADDSGLEVDALDGRPGVRSARYAPGTDADRYRALLEELEGRDDRAARFVCAMALAVPGQAPVIERGTCEGRIALVPEGDGGFGYDPVFLVQGEARTMATLRPEEKNARSHRGAALRKMAPHLEKLFDA